MEQGQLDEFIRDLSVLMVKEKEIIQKRTKMDKEYQKYNSLIIEYSRTQLEICKELEKLSMEEKNCMEQKTLTLKRIEKLKLMNSTPERSSCPASSENVERPFGNDVSGGGDSFAQDIQKTLESILNEDEKATEFETDLEELSISSFYKNTKFESSRNDSLSSSATEDYFDPDKSIISTASCISKPDETLLALAADANFLYKSLSNAKVVGQNIKNKKDVVIYNEHRQNVRTLYVDDQLKFLYTGCDDGYLRCFDCATGRMVCKYNVGESVLSIVRGWKEYFVVSTVNNWIYVISELFDKTKARYKMAETKLASVTYAGVADGKSRLIVLPIGFNPALVNALDGKVVDEFGEDEIQLPAFGVAEEHLFYLATLKYSNSSIIAVYNIPKKCSCVWRQLEDGQVNQLQVKDLHLYIVLKQNETYQLRCFEFVDDQLFIRWVSYIGYFPITLLAPISPRNVLAGSQYGFVHHTAVDKEGPFPCATPCNCNLYFARQSDLDIHLFNNLIK